VKTKNTNIERELPNEKHWTPILDKVEKSMAKRGKKPIERGRYWLADLVQAELKLLRVPAYMRTVAAIAYLLSLRLPMQVIAAPRAAYMLLTQMINRNVQRPRINENKETVIRERYAAELAVVHIARGTGKLFGGQKLLATTEELDISLIYNVADGVDPERIKFEEGNVQKQSHAELWMRDARCNYTATKGPDNSTRGRIAGIAKWWVRVERNHNPDGVILNEDYMNLFSNIQVIAAMVLGWFTGKFGEKHSRSSSWAVFTQAVPAFDDAGKLDLLEEAAKAFVCNGPTSDKVYGFQQLGIYYSTRINDAQGQEQRMFCELLNMLTILLNTGECKVHKKLRNVTNKRITELRDGLTITAELVETLLRDADYVLTVTDE
jgi:hypothetical protein